MTLTDAQIKETRRKRQLEIDAKNTREAQFRKNRAEIHLLAQQLLKEGKLL